MANKTLPNLCIGDTVVINHKSHGLALTPALVTAVHDDGTINVTAVHPNGLVPLEHLAPSDGRELDGWMTKEQATTMTLAAPPPGFRTAPVGSTGTTGTPPPLPGLPLNPRSDR